MDIGVPILAVAITDDLEVVYVASWTTILVIERNYPQYQVQYQ